MGYYRLFRVIMGYSGLLWGFVVPHDSLDLSLEHVELEVTFKFRLFVNVMIEIIRTNKYFPVFLNKEYRRTGITYQG